MEEIKKEICQLTTEELLTKIYNDDNGCTFLCVDKKAYYYWKDLFSKLLPKLIEHKKLIPDDLLIYPCIIYFKVDTSENSGDDVMTGDRYNRSKIYKRYLPSYRGCSYPYKGIVDMGMYSTIIPPSKSVYEGTDPVEIYKNKLLNQEI